MSVRRRELLVAGAGGAAALALGGLAAPAARANDTDKALVAQLLALEQATAFAYGALLQRSSLLTPDLRDLLGKLHDQEQVHVTTIRTLMRQAIGGQPLPVPDSVDAVDKIVPGLADVASREDAVAYARKLEDAEVAVQVKAIAQLSDARAIQTVAQVLGAEGQHLVLLRLAAGDDPLPEPLEDGTADPS